MKFCCTSANSSKQRKSLKTSLKAPIDSSSLYSGSYATISASSIPKSDSGFSETGSTRETSTLLTQLLQFERIYYQHLKAFIIKYSRPLRRYLHPEEISRLFQNIEKISAISESIIRQCEKSRHGNHLLMYQSWSGVMVDSYRSYISRCHEARTTLKQCQEKIAYFLQMPKEFILDDLTDFLLLPMRHISQVERFFQTFTSEHANLNDSLDEQFLQDLKSLSEQAMMQLQPSPLDRCSSAESSEDMSFLSEISPVVVLKRTSKHPWEAKRLELLDSRLAFSCLDRSTITSSVCLSNIVHLEDYSSNGELRLIVATASTKPSRQASSKLSSVYLRFENEPHCQVWAEHLQNAIQQAKDQSWRQTNELII